jgi:predicted hotdog family 3-hydroxylacyl-ACP dehydratase
MTELRLPLAAEELIPHRRPLRLVDRLLEIDGKNGVVEALIAAENPLVDGQGYLEDVALTELLAQAYAAVKGYLDRVAEKPVRQGFLVGIKKFVKLSSVRASERLRIVIRTLGELEDFAVGEGEIWRASELVARGEIKVWIP